MYSTWRSRESSGYCDCSRFGRLRMAVAFPIRSTEGLRDGVLVLSFRTEGCGDSFSGGLLDASDEATEAGKDVKDVRRSALAAARLALVRGGRVVVIL